MGILLDQEWCLEEVLVRLLRMSVSVRCMGVHIGVSVGVVVLVLLVATIAVHILVIEHEARGRRCFRMFVLHIPPVARIGCTTRYGLRPFWLWLQAAEEDPEGPRIEAPASLTSKFLCTSGD